MGRKREDSGRGDHAEAADPQEQGEMGHPSAHGPLFRCPAEKIAIENGSAGDADGPGGPELTGSTHRHLHFGGGGQYAPSPGGRSRARKSLLLTLLITSVILTVELIGGLITNSLALLADAGHMLVDVSAILMALLAIQLGSRPADVKRSYGYYRLEILAALANGILLLGLSAYLMFEAVSRIFNPVQVDTGPMLAVAVVGLLANLTALRILSPNRGNLNVKGAFFHIMGDVLSSVGVITGGLIMHFTGHYIVDPIITMVIGAIIIVSAVRLIMEAGEVLLESVPAHIDLTEVLQRMQSFPGVLNVHDLHIWSITSGFYALSAHVVISDEMEGGGDELLAAIKQMLDEEFKITKTTIQMETEGYLQQLRQSSGAEEDPDRPSGSDED